MTSPTTLVELRDVNKSFGATQAVKHLSLNIPMGRVIGLVGENGAGKSTVAKMIAGVHAPDSGTIEIQGRVHRFRTPHEALKAGVAIMAQEILLVPEATVEGNVFLGNMPTRGPFPDRGAMRRRYEELTRLTGFELDPDRKVSTLRLADQQKVEILRSLSQDARLIVMDEPSASLTADEVVRLHNTIRTVVSRGATVLLVSHYLEEVLTLTDTVAIMRDGELVRSGPTSQENVDSLVAGMVGRSLETRYFESTKERSPNVRLQVRNLNRGAVLRDVSFDVHEGEIVGLAGLIGAGRTEIARAVFGVDGFDSGEIIVNGTPVKLTSPSDALRNGIFMVPESRTEQGLLLGRNITDNMLLPTLRRRSKRGWLSTKTMDRVATQLAEDVDLRYSSVRQSAGSLSGGNQQKILFGRSMEVAPNILLVDEPTRGVDIAAKRAIHQTLVEMADAGLSILFISSEIEEVLGVCDRVLVIYRGGIKAEFVPPFDQGKIVAEFFGQIPGRAND